MESKALLSFMSSISRFAHRGNKTPSERERERERERDRGLGFDIPAVCKRILRKTRKGRSLAPDQKMLAASLASATSQNQNSEHCCQPQTCSTLKNKRESFQTEMRPSKTK
jgi:hypothetical protein